MVRTVSVRIKIHEEKNYSAPNQTVPSQILMQYFRKHLWPCNEQILSLSTATVQTKLHKKLHAFITTYVNKHTLSCTQCYVQK